MKSAVSSLSDLLSPRPPSDISDTLRFVPQHSVFEYLKQVADLPGGHKYHDWLIHASRPYQSRNWSELTPAGTRFSDVANCLIGACCQDDRGESCIGRHHTYEGGIHRSHEAINEWIRLGPSQMIPRTPTLCDDGSTFKARRLVASTDCVVAFLLGASDQHSPVSRLRGNIHLLQLTCSQWVAALPAQSLNNMVVLPHGEHAAQICRSLKCLSSSGEHGRAPTRMRASSQRREGGARVLHNLANGNSPFDGLKTAAEVRKTHSELQRVLECGSRELAGLVRSVLEQVEATPREKDALRDLEGCLCMKHHCRTQMSSGEEEEDEDASGSSISKQKAALDALTSLCESSNTLNDACNAVLVQSFELIETRKKFSLLFSSWRTERRLALQRWQHRLCGSSMDILHIVDASDLESCRSFGAQFVHFCQPDDKAQGLVRFVCLALPPPDAPDLEAAWMRVAVILGLARREACMLVLANHDELSAVLEGLTDPGVNLHLAAHRLVPWGPLPGDPEAPDLQDKFCKEFARCNHVFALVQKDGDTGMHGLVSAGYASFSIVSCRHGPDNLEEQLSALGPACYWGVQRAGAVTRSGMLDGAKAVHLTLSAQLTQQLCDQDPGPLASVIRMCASENGSVPPVLQHGIDTVISMDLFRARDSHRHYTPTLGVHHHGLHTWEEFECYLNPKFWCLESASGEESEVRSSPLENRVALKASDGEFFAKVEHDMKVRTLIQ